jgi:glycosyltransferase involved in cell wall biosynthesis
MHVHVIDPSAFTPPYDRALCAALARAGADVELITSRFPYGDVPPAAGYAVRELFYRRARGPAGSRRRAAAKLLEHVPDMLLYRRLAQSCDVAHFQWLDVQWLDSYLLPRRPLVLTAHDLLPREPRLGQARAQRRLYDAVDAIVVHSDYGRRMLVERLDVPAEKVSMIHHGAFDHLVTEGADISLPAPLGSVEVPVVLFFGLLRPYKGIDVLLRAWRGVSDAELWIVGRSRMLLEPLRAAAPPSVRFVTRYVSDAELAAYFRRADVVVLPYTRTERLDQSGVLATALAFGKPSIVSDVGGFPEVAATGAATLVPPGDADALQAAIGELLADPGRREELARAARAAAAGAYSWEQAANATIELYREVADSQPPPAPQSAPP